LLFFNITIIWAAAQALNLIRFKIPKLGGQIRFLLLTKDNNKKLSHAVIETKTPQLIDKENNQSINVNEDRELRLKQR